MFISVIAIIDGARGSIDHLEVMEVPGSFSESEASSAAGRRALVRLRRRVVVTALVAGLPLVLLAGAWPAAGVSGFGDDTLYYFPMRTFVGQWWSQGVWPTWNPLSAMGTSLVADPQAGLFYPGTWLFALMPVVWAYPLTQILHFALAGGGMYRWLRAERMEWRAALLGAIGFEFCAYLVGHRAHLTIHHAAAWLPWIFYGWTRFAQTRAYRHFALAVVAYGLHMLVQHMQITIIMSLILAGYAGFVLWPRRRSLWWVFPCGGVLGAMIGAIQTVPTFLQFAGSTRQVAAYYIFIENAWSPVSAVMLLFPMFFGNTTHTFYAQTWWGISHFCEQFAYPTILILVLAGGSLALMRRADRRWDRRVVFWWLASVAALVIALGDLTPLSKWLFHVPVYRNLRVPARWLLVWSVAFPFLAAAVAHVLLQGVPGGRRRDVEGAVRVMVLRVLPGLTVIFLSGIVVAWWNVARLEAWFGHRWSAEAFFAGLREAVWPGNPALWIPLLLMMATGGLVLMAMKERRGLWVGLLGLVWLADIASVASAVDVNSGWMTARDLTEPPVLAEKLHELDPRGTGRLLVPRFHFHGHRPLDVLAPSTNVMFDVPTLASYGPLWPQANRLLFRMAPWGASESIVELMRNTSLCQAMGIRYVAVRSEAERELFHRATVAPVDDVQLEEIDFSKKMKPVPWREGIFWPVRVDEPGLYQLSFTAERNGDSSSRFFVSLEEDTEENIDRTRGLDPVDLSEGKRELHFLFYADQAVERARVRVKSESGVALRAGRARFGRVGEAISGDEGQRRRNAEGLGYRHAAEVQTASEEVISVYEVEEAVDLLYWAEDYEMEYSTMDVVANLRNPENRTRSATSVVGTTANARAFDANGRFFGDTARSSIRGWERPRPDEVVVRVKMDGPGLLVFNETYDPGWRAFIDGRPVEIWRINAVVQGVGVPAGAGEVRFVYRPVGVLQGAGIAVAGWGLLLAVGGLALLRARKAGDSNVRGSYRRPKPVSP